MFVLDPETSECLHYEPVIGYPPKTHAGIPREILAEHPEVEIRNDLIDCCIDVCSVEVRTLCHYRSRPQINVGDRFLHCSKTILTTLTSGETSYTASLHPISSSRTYTVILRKKVMRLALRTPAVTMPSGTWKYISFLVTR